MPSKVPPSLPLKRNKEIKYDLSVLQRRIANRIQDGPKTLEDLEQFLMGWWCRHYSRPYKDPLVLEYTLEELLFEYFDVQLRNDPDKLKEVLEGVESGGDTDDEEWLHKMMGKGYTNKEEQEKALKPAKKDIETAVATDKEDISMTFDLDEYK